jgi:hypothetical protein
MLEASLAFTVGAVLGASVRALLPTSSTEPAQPPPPPPPPPPPICGRKPKTRIFYKMKELPLTVDGEDTRGMRKPEDEVSSAVVVTTCSSNSGRPKITDEVISAVVLKRAPPRMSMEEKKASFFEPQRPIHVELFQRLHTLHPQL